MFHGDRVHGWEERLIDGLIKVVERISRQPETEKGPRRKFVGYDDLLKILGNADCPVCFMVRRSLRHYLSIELIEELTVPEFREPLQTSLGYCKGHSEYVGHASRNRLQAMGVAIVYEDLLRIVERRLENRTSSRPTGDCPLCGIQKDVESYAVQLIADYASDMEFHQHYDNAQGVCIRHLHAISLLVQGEAYEFLISSHEKKLSRLIGNLDEFIRKHDYRFTSEKPTGAEAHSCQQAVRCIVGS